MERASFYATYSIYHSDNLNTKHSEGNLDVKNKAIITSASHKRVGLWQNKPRRGSVGRYRFILKIPRDCQWMIGMPQHAWV